eukprot:CAMPEP_0184515588 /NCGR_PEP_ID=MMETSP0198_2-20121128/4574_1 /TAXON_ID=1112570 /ORGANISM="Thraustochytrium sp., Strain LLF1b" /LENGTH=204 /DNA_ID=CAMNT_0026905849 /DNA_START=468 /DNA_END=1079 /DNA_ORIENTATION=+
MAKLCIQQRSDEMHQVAAAAVKRRLDLRAMGLGRDSASEDELLQERGEFAAADEDDDWQEHWDEVTQRVFYFSPSRNERSFDPYGNDQFERALVGKYVRVQDIFTEIWRGGQIVKINPKKRKHRIDFYEGGEKDHEWMYVKQEEARIQVYDEETESWGMLKNLRVAFKQLQLAMEAEIDQFSATIGADSTYTLSFGETLNSSTA